MLVLSRKSIDLISPPLPNLCYRQKALDGFQPGKLTKALTTIISVTTWSVAPGCLNVNRLRGCLSVRDKADIVAHQPTLSIVRRAVHDNSAEAGKWNIQYTSLVQGHSQHCR